MWWVQESQVIVLTRPRSSEDIHRDPRLDLVSHIFHLGRKPTFLSFLRLAIENLGILTRSFSFIYSFRRGWCIRINVTLPMPPSRLDVLSCPRI